VAIVSHLRCFHAADINSYFEGGVRFNLRVIHVAGIVWFCQERLQYVLYWNWRRAAYAVFDNCSNLCCGGTMHIVEGRRNADSKFRLGFGLFYKVLSARKIYMRPATSTQGFFGFLMSISEC
jgi:hypothetical protein